MREIKISQETASRWYNGTDSELKALALQTYPELAVKDLPKNWEELKVVKGYQPEGINLFETKEQASAAEALAKLSQLMKLYNDGWVADWSDYTHKYCIHFDEYDFEVMLNITTKKFLNFKDRKTAELFLENFSSLIQTAKPLL